MRRTAIAALLTVVLASAVAPAHSSTHVSVYNNYFNPTPAAFEPGHDATWTWSCDTYGGGCAGLHNVTAYQGASFASGDRAYPSSYTATIPSDASVVKYRCTLHSTLNNGACMGMCGVLGTDTSKPTATLDSPEQNEVVLGTTVPVQVRFAGTATDDSGVVAVRVRVYDLLGRAIERDATCTGGCGATSINWTAQIALSPGTYLAEALPYDSLGNNQASGRTRFFVV